MAFFRKIQAGLVKAEITEFVGEEGNLFFNIETGELRLSDGVTPGGLPVAGVGGATISETQPNNPNEGDIWYKESTNELSIFGGIWSTVAGGDGSGPRGFTGSKGEIGFTGSQGIQGYTGSQGVGYTGSQGIQGYTGSQGVGFAGSQGIQGYTGSQGVGFTGSQGIQGTQGYTGSQGIPGEAAAIGYTGSAGSVTGLTSNLTNTITVNTGYSIVPQSDGQQDLGTAQKKFRSLYLSGNSLYIDDSRITVNEQGQFMFYDNSNSLIAVHSKEIYIGSADDPTLIRKNPTTGAIEMVLNAGQSDQQIYNVAIGYTGSQGNIGYTGSQGPSGPNRINTASDVDPTNLTDGSVLVYATNAAKWRSTINMFQQVIDGGEF